MVQYIQKSWTNDKNEHAYNSLSYGTIATMTLILMALWANSVCR